jgi:hypothetical protein
MKKVIFVAGTSYSGSTLLDLILSNDIRGFSCGEVYALFIPYRVHHLNPECICGDPDCEIWKKLKIVGKRRLYERLFQYFKEIDFLVDSSKNYIWIKDQIELLKLKNHNFKNVLIWKNPMEFALSCLKRNKMNSWREEWLRYHKKYFAIVKEFYAVRYSDLVRDTNKTLQQLCHKLEIEHFDGKEHYWNKKHHTLFGSKTATSHLTDFNTKNKKKIKNQEKRNIDNKIRHRTLFYKEPKGNLLLDQITEEIKKDKEIKKIMKILENKSEGVQTDFIIYNSSKMNLSLTYEKYIMQIRSLIFRLRHN